MAVCYISKGDWFDVGTEAVLIDDYRNGLPSLDSGLFHGVRNGIPDEEICGFDEFVVTLVEGGFNE